MSEQMQREIISPEGVEERVISEDIYRITMTGGGKYRIYHSSGGKLHSIGVLDTREEAEKKLGTGMLMHGGLLVAPKKTMELLLSSMTKPRT